MPTEKQLDTLRALQATYAKAKNQKEKTAAEKMLKKQMKKFNVTMVPKKAPPQPAQVYSFKIPERVLTDQDFWDVLYGLQKHYDPSFTIIANHIHSSDKFLLQAINKVVWEYERKIILSQIGLDAKRRLKKQREDNERKFQEDKKNMTLLVCFLMAMVASIIAYGILG